MEKKKLGEPGYAREHFEHLKKLDEEEKEYRARFGRGRFDPKA